MTAEHVGSGTSAPTDANMSNSSSDASLATSVQTTPDFEEWIQIQIKMYGMWYQVYSHYLRLAFEAGMRRAYENVNWSERGE